ncbi:MAG TPA: dihydrodipicolinate synthase family protein [Bryobacteraceae bacterium]|nr:dihydrodipicolinate synthase family protein [Bryobacteraceae bacterium]
MADFEGVNVAALTPRGKQGDVDLGVAFELVDMLCRAGAAGIALFTATGEYAAFSPDERSRLVYLARKRSRVPVLVGVGSATLEISVALSREARQAGAAALLLPPPFYFRYQQDDIHAFYHQFAQQLGGGIPVWLVNYPAFTTPIEPTTAVCLLETGWFAGMVDASGDRAAYAGLESAAARCSLPILAGHDTLLLEAGARGWLSPAASAIPELVVALYRALAAQDRARVDRLTPLFQQFVSFANSLPEPAVVKLAAALRGLKTGPLAVPLPLAREREIDRFREWFQGWLPEMKKMAVNA